MYVCIQKPVNKVLAPEELVKLDDEEEEEGGGEGGNAAAAQSMVRVYENVCL